MNDDELLRAAFNEMKSDDAREQHSFDTVLSGSAAPRASYVSPTLRLAAAGVVIVAAIATYRTIAARDQRLTVPSEVVALGAWRPPTDAFLPARTGLLRAQPVLGPSILDLDTLTAGALR